MKLLVEVKSLCIVYVVEGEGLLGVYSEGGVWGWCRCGRRKGCGVVVGAGDGSGMREDEGYLWVVLC